MRKINLVLGWIYLILGIVILLNSFQGITGFVVFSDASVGWGWFLGLVFVVIGVVVLAAGREDEEGGLEKLAKVKGEIGRTLKSGRIGSYNELKSYATKLGYELKEGPEHTEVYKDKVRITDIPRHKKTRKGTYRKIIKALYNAA